MKQANLQIGYHENQMKIFYESDARYKIIAKGRRFGLTRGFANYAIDQMLEGVTPILWVDTIYSNIERYVERYFLPVLKGLPNSLWRYRTNRNDLKINNSVLDFRSADKPENIEGFGYALIILNEAGIILKNRRLWEESIRPMAMDYKAKVLIGGTPKGKKVRKTNEVHLFYELYQRGNPPLNPPEINSGQALQGGEISDISTQWESFNFSSYDNPLIEKSEIDELANDISPSLREQEIYGKFVDKENSGIIKADWWPFYEPQKLFENRILKIVQSWDTAFKDKEGNDFSVCTTWAVGLNAFYLIDMWRKRVEFPELKKKAAELYELHKANEVLIEDKASGQSLIQELQRETKIAVKPIKVDKDKIARVHAVTPLIEAGKVLLPLNTPWTKQVINECEDFPDSEFDDVVDSISQFLNYVKGGKGLSKEPVIHVRREKVLNKYRRFRKSPFNSPFAKGG